MYSSTPVEAEEPRSNLGARYSKQSHKQNSMVYDGEEPPDEEEVDDGCNLDVEMIEFIVGSFIKLFPQEKPTSRRRFDHRLREDARGKCTATYS